MSSQIRVYHPGLDPADFWIEKAFVTVGSAVTADIRVEMDGAPPASANVRYSEGQFKFFNQSFEDVTLDDQPVVRGKSVTWPAGARLQFSDGVELELLIEGNPAPSPRTATFKPSPKSTSPVVDIPTADQLDAPDTDGIPAAPKPPKSSRSTELLQAAVIVLCIGGCIGMIVASSQKPQTAEAVHDEFAELVSEGFAAEQKDPADALRKSQWTHKLQQAERAFRKGDAASARQQFSLLKSRLASARRSDAAGQTDAPAAGSLPAFEQRLLRYAEQQLSRIP